MMLLWMQAEGLTDFHKAIRDRFQQGGSIAAFLLAIGALVGFVLLIGVLSKWQKRAATAPTSRPDPQRLFDDLLKKLGLAAEQARLVRRMADRAALKHPTVLLLNEALFENHSAELIQSGLTTPDGRLSVELAAARARIFPPCGEPPRAAAPNQSK
jgi:hypothetical protein